jgi:hypothetical protein
MRPCAWVTISGTWFHKPMRHKLMEILPSVIIIWSLKKGALPKTPAHGEQTNSRGRDAS